MPPALTHRPRRLRRLPFLRDMMAETRLSADQLIQGAFVVPGKVVKDEISAMPGIHRMSTDVLVEYARRLEDAGLKSLILFGIPESKDARGSGADDPHGIIQRALEALRGAGSQLVLIADACLCEYTDHGHCGILSKDRSETVDNDSTLERLADLAVSLAGAGADIIAPSGMMDGTVRAVREALDGAGHEAVPILMYSAKFASAYYGPFREAAQGAPQFGDRRAYQMDGRNRREALREVRLDAEQGADIVMVKPALAYLDIIADVRAATDLPVCAYNVSGEYAMVKAAAARGWVDERAIVLENLTAMTRAGADLIITYHAEDAAGWLRG